jgi:integrase
MGARLTDKLVSGIEPPAKGNRITYDAPDKNGHWIAGFGCCVTSAGHRSFVLNYRNSDGRARRLTIGSPPAWSVEAARREAAELKYRIDNGDDPLAEREAVRRAETVGQLIDLFIRDHVVGRRSERDYRSSLEEVRHAIGTVKVGAVTSSDLQRLHRAITARKAPYRANRVMACASRMFNYAVRQKMRPDNPVKDVERNTESRRERYLSESELSRLTAALAAHPDQGIADMFRFALWTGARIGECQHATWNQFDGDFARWTKPSSVVKTGKDHSVPLSAPARQMLARISRTSKADLVFRPVDYSWLRRVFAKICRAAQIRGLRIHDLRHSYASTLVNADVPLPVIGKLLGHSKTATTERYSHLYPDTLKRATEIAGKMLSKPVAVKGGKS